MGYMATTKQSSIRFTDEDIAILDEVQHRTGLVSRSDALRFALRQHAIAEGFECMKPKPKRPSKS